MMLADAISKIRTMRQQTSLMGYVVPQLGTRTEREITPDMWIGISRVGSFCPRAYTLAYLQGGIVADEMAAAARWRADGGTAIHRMVQEEWLGPLRVLLGGWMCPECGYRHGATLGEGPILRETAVTLPHACERCGLSPSRHKRFRYEEISVVDHELKLRGNLDGIYRLPAQRDVILDVKSVQSLVSVMARPRQTDVEQIIQYMERTRIRRGMLLYIDRASSRFDMGIREHRVDYDYYVSEKSRGKIRTFRQAARAAEEGKAGPVPACPYGGKGPYGDCQCTKM